MRKTLKLKNITRKVFIATLGKQPINEVFYCYNAKLSRLPRTAAGAALDAERGVRPGESDTVGVYKVTFEPLFRYRFVKEQRRRKR